jgi:hypothetical protein
MGTTKEQIEKMRHYAKELEKLDGVTAAHVDDWGRYGNFGVMYFINTTNAKLNLRKINNQARKILKEIAPEAKVRDIFSPKRTYDRSYGMCYFSGYEFGNITIDVDFNNYSQETNSFS